MVRDTHTPQSLKLQIPVAFMIVAAFLLLPWCGIIPPAFFVTLFLGIGWPEIRDCLAKDSLKLGFAAPALLLIRSLGLGLGLIAGLFALITSGDRIESDGKQHR